MRSSFNYMDDLGEKYQRNMEIFREDIIYGQEENIVKKIVSLLETAALFFMAFPMTAWAAEGSAESISPAFCIPFAGLLLCVAVLPLIKAEWWESHQLHVVIFWSLLFIVPFAVFWGAGEAAEKVLECIIDDYLTFIVLLFGLFCVSGNITLEGDLAGSPRINVGLLLLGTMLSSWVGTTGASMLMVRPMIKMNAWRKRRSHIMVFFIFLISNMGGCLTPIGDPPLLMGFMRGVPFFWSLHLLPILIFNTVVLLTVFYFLDRRAYRKDIAEGRKPDISKPGTEVHILGLHNLIFLAMIVAAVILSGTLPGMAAFQDVNGAVKGIPVFEDVKLTYPALIEVVIILAAAFLSFKTTKPEIRRKNHFTWGAIKEVAVLFVGIFITMQPALMILKAKGQSLVSQSLSKCSGQPGFCQAFWTIHLLIWYFLQQPVHLALQKECRPFLELYRLPCWRQYPVVLYLWEPIPILEMHQTLW